MGNGRPAAGGGRWIEVAPERTSRWLAGFGGRHGGVIRAEARPEGVRLTAADGAVADCRAPFPPLAQACSGDPVGLLIEHALRPRRVGVVLVRLGGYAIGVFDGEILVVSKVGSRLVHGRSAAGGWSQQRFARRRDKQARQALQDAADVAAGVLRPHLAGLAAVVLGGDRRAVEELRRDPRLAPVFALATEAHLTVPDPKLAVLQQTPRSFRAVKIHLTEPPGAAVPGAAAPQRPVA